MNGYRISFANIPDCAYELECIGETIRSNSFDSGNEVFKIFKNYQKALL